MPDRPRQRAGIGNRPNSARLHHDVVLAAIDDPTKARQRDAQLDRGQQRPLAGAAARGSLGPRTTLGTATPGGSVVPIGLGQPQQETHGTIPPSVRQRARGDGEDILQPLSTIPAAGHQSANLAVP